MNKFWQYINVIRLSAGASLLIGLGDYVLLKIGEPIGPFLFAFGLLGVCVMGLNLFTGKCGYLIQDRIGIFRLLLILAANLVFGYAIGVIFSLMDGTVVANAAAKVVTWEFSWAFFLKAVACGAIMYLAVELYRRGNIFGILIGVPLFIFCGFQHSIANIITLGIATSFSWTIILAILGNFVGSIVTWVIARELPSTDESESKASRRTASARGTASTRKSSARRTGR